MDAINSLSPYDNRLRNDSQVALILQNYRLESKPIAEGADAKIFIWHPLVKHAPLICEKTHKNSDSFKKEQAIYEILGTHSNIVKIHGTQHLSLYLEMGSGSLSEQIKGPLNGTLYFHKNKFRIIMNILSGLMHMHKINITHNDLNGKNIILFEIDNLINAKIADFAGSTDFRNEKRVTLPLAPELRPYTEPVTITLEESILTDETDFSKLVYNILADIGDDTTIPENSDTVLADRGFAEEIREAIRKAKNGNPLKLDHWEQLLSALKKSGKFCT